MITEFAMATLMVCIANKMTSHQESNAWKTKEMKPHIKIFNEVCKNNNLNYLLIDGSITEYGCKLMISLKNKTFEELEKLKNTIEIAFKSDVEIMQNENKCTATLEIFLNKLNDEEHKFKPISCKPHELFISKDYKFNNIIADMNQHTHCLISGTNGSGKSSQIKTILTNLIAPNNSKVEMYISNITNSPDFRSFLNCHQVKGYVETVDETLKMLKYIQYVFEQRLKIINKHDCDNIKDYNNRFRRKQMTYVYIFIDEFAQYFPDDKDDPEYNSKVQCKVMLKKFSEILRKTGVFLVVSTQRPDTNSISPSMKCNLRTKIGYAQENEASSLVVCDKGYLVGLANREFLYIAGNERVWARSLYLDKEMIEDYIKDSYKENRRKLNDYNKFLKEEIDGEKTKETSKVKSIKRAKKSNAKSEVATTDIKVTRVKNVEVLENIDYEVIDGKICLRMNNKISS